MKRFGLLLLALLTACAGAIGTSKMPQTLGAATVIERFFQATGTAGTVTVGTGKYATMCSAAGTATNMTAVVTPCLASPAVSCTTSYTVTIPSGNPVAIPFPSAANGVADGSTIVFSNTLAYFCNEWQYNP